MLVCKAWWRGATSNKVWRPRCRAACINHSEASLRQVRAAVARCRTWHAAYRRIPQAYVDGVYYCRQFYYRRGVRDMWADENRAVLKVVYYRALMFRPGQSSRQGGMQ